MEAEMLLCRALEWMPLMERQLSEHGVDMMPSHLHVTFGLFIPHFCSLMSVMSRQDYTPQWLPIVNGVEGILSTLLQLMSQQSCQNVQHWNEAYRRDLLFLLSTISCALASDKGVSKDAVKSIVTKYVEYSCNRFTSLLHLALHGASYITKTLRLCGCRDNIAAYVLLIEVVQSIVPCINVPYQQFFCKGERPIHMAARLVESDPCYAPVLDYLLAEGAHFDAVSSRGATMQSIITRHTLKPCYHISLKPLSCLVAVAIVRYCLNYKDSFYLPSKIRDFIGYHDWK